MQKQQHFEEKKRLEEYESAQRAAVESIMVGRATAEAVEQQGDQLKRAEYMADDTQYKLDKANRILKGMTWGGWMSNVFSKDIVAPTNDPDANRPLEYDKLPESCQPAAQAVQNYNANVMVLVDCETEEQKATLITVCNQMYAMAKKAVEDVVVEGYQAQLLADLNRLRNKQITSQSQIRGLVDRVTSPSSSTTNHDGGDNQQKRELFGRAPQSNSTSNNNGNNNAPTLHQSPKSKREQEQDQHLELLAVSMGELGQIATTLNTGLGDQQQRIDRLEDKSDNVLETSKLVGRRTDRLIQAKSWTKAKPVYVCTVTIRHRETGKYLSATKNEIFLFAKAHPVYSFFKLYKRHGTLFGLSVEGKWLGQSFMTGTLTTNKSFGKREEWQVDDIQNFEFESLLTRLLCASAGWGQGGYLKVSVRDSEHYVDIGNVQDSATAALWNIENQDTK